MAPGKNSKGNAFILHVRKMGNKYTGKIFCQAGKIILDIAGSCTDI